MYIPVLPIPESPLGAQCLFIASRVHANLNHEVCTGTPEYQCGSTPSSAQRGNGARCSTLEYGEVIFSLQHPYPPVDLKVGLDNCFNGAALDMHLLQGVPPFLAVRNFQYTPHRHTHACQRKRSIGFPSPCITHATSHCMLSVTTLAHLAV